MNNMKNWIKRFFCKHDEDIYPITKKGRLGGECCIGWTHVCKKCGNSWDYTGGL
jgi:hypothetical protein